MTAANITDERLRFGLDTNQLARERMCLAILALQPGYSNVKSRRPRGGPDGGRDIEAVYKDQLVVWGAVGFQNSISDSPEDKKNAKAKYKDDLERALKENPQLQGFVFFTNVDLTPGEVEGLQRFASDRGVKHCEVFYREILRQILDSSPGVLFRLQYLDISMTPEEQVAFFTTYGKRLEAMLFGRFDDLDEKVRRLEFLQDSQKPLMRLRLLLDLNARLGPTELGHFRVQIALVRSNRLGNSELCLGARDHFCEEVHGEVRTRLYACRSMMWSSKVGKPRGCIRGTEEAVERIEASMDLDNTCPLQTLGELEGAHVHLCMSQPLVKQVAAVSLVADDYVLFQLGMTSFVARQAAHVPAWPEELTASEKTVPWIELPLKAPDGEKWPTRLWTLDFREVIPTRVVAERVFEPTGMVAKLVFPGAIRRMQEGDVK